MKSRNRSDRVQTQVHEPILRQLPAWFAGVWLSAACVRKFCLYEHSAFTEGEETQFPTRAVWHPLGVASLWTSTPEVTRRLLFLQRNTSILSPTAQYLLLAHDFHILKIRTK